MMGDFLALSSIINLLLKCDTYRKAAPVNRATTQTSVGESNMPSSPHLAAGNSQQELSSKHNVPKNGYHGSHVTPSPSQPYSVHQVQQPL